jgi:drug/metabolite transporter (DMT)-like permease
VLARTLLLVTVTVWGWTFVATKVALSVLGPIEVMALRFAIGLPVLGLLLATRRTRPVWPWQDRGVAAGALLITVHFLVQITGLQTTSAINTGWIIGVTPLILAVLARVLLGERLPRLAWAGVAVASAGILLLVSGGRLTSLRWLRSTGDWLVLASAHTWALYTIAVRGPARRLDPLALTFAVLLPATVLSCGWVAAGGRLERFATLPAEVLGALLFLGVLGTALAHWFWQLGVARVGAAGAGLFLYLEPVATTAIAVPLLGEPFGVTTLAGGVLVLGGVWLSQWRRGHQGEGSSLPPHPSRE